MQVTECVDVGGWARSYLLSDDALWLPFWQDDVVARVSATTFESVHKTPVGAVRTKPLRAGTHVWVPSYDTETISCLDPSTGVVADQIDIGEPTYSFMRDGTSIWACLFSQLVQLDVETGIEINRLRGPDDINTVQFHDGQFWLRSDLGRNLFTIDPEAGELRQVTEPGAFTAFSRPEFAFGSAWVPGRGSLLRIDTGSLGSVGPPMPLADNRRYVTNVVAAFGSIWMAADDDELWRIDPATHEMQHIGRGGGEETIIFPAGDYLLVGKFGGRLTVYSGETGETILELDYPAQPMIEALGCVWLIDGETGSVNRMRLADMSITSLDLREEIEFTHPEFAGVSWLAQVGDSIVAHIEGKLARFK